MGGVAGSRGAAARAGVAAVAVVLSAAAAEGGGGVKVGAFEAATRRSTNRGKRASLVELEVFCDLLSDNAGKASCSDSFDSCGSKFAPNAGAYALKK